MSRTTTYLSPLPGLLPGCVSLAMLCDHAPEGPPFRLGQGGLAAGLGRARLRKGSPQRHKDTKVRGDIAAPGACQQR